MKKYLIFSFLVLVGCSNKGPIVDMCISDPANNGFQCIDKVSKDYFLAYDNSGNMIAFYPDDAHKLLKFCKDQGRK